MRCDDVRGLFSEYFDYEAGFEIDFEDEAGVDFEDKAAISAHLHECAECRLEYEKFRSLINELQSLPEPQLPTGFSDTLRQAINDHKANDKRENAPFSEGGNTHQKADNRSRWRIAYQGFAVAAAAGILFAMVWFSGLLGNFGNNVPVESMPMADGAEFLPMGENFSTIDAPIRILPNNEVLPLPEGFEIEWGWGNENGDSHFIYLCECESIDCENKDICMVYGFQNINGDDFQDVDFSAYQRVAVTPIELQLDEPQVAYVNENDRTNILPLIMIGLYIVVAGVILSIVLKKRKK